MFQMKQQQGYVQRCKTGGQETFGTTLQLLLFYNLRHVTSWSVTWNTIHKWVSNMHLCDVTILYNQLLNYLTNYIKYLMVLIQFNWMKWWIISSTNGTKLTEIDKEGRAWTVIRKGLQCITFTEQNQEMQMLYFYTVIP